MTRESERLRQARGRHLDAVRDERLARIAAAPALRIRARRKHAALRIAIAAAVVVAIAAACVGLWATLSASAMRSDAASLRAAVASASDAVVTMLTPDPVHPDAYLDAISDDSTGDQRERFQQNHDPIADYVRSLTVRPAGRIVSAGAESGGDAGSDRVAVVLVAQATDPTLVGGQRGQQRVTLRVDMIDTDGRWLVADTERLS